MTVHRFHITTPPQSMLLESSHRKVHGSPSYGSLRKVQEGTFEAIFGAEFARVINVISKYGTNYVTNETLHYWYASLIMGLATKLIDTAESDTLKDGGRPSNNTFNFKVDWVAFQVIKATYFQAQDADPEPIVSNLCRIMQKTDERIRQLEQEARRKIDELHRQREEVQRKREEVRLLREKAELELESRKAVAGDREDHQTRYMIDILLITARPNARRRTLSPSQNDDLNSGIQHLGERAIANEWGEEALTYIEHTTSSRMDM